MLLPMKFYPSAVYHSMKSDAIKVVNVLPLEDLELFWKGIWNVKEENCTAA